MHADDNKDVLEVRANILRGERQRSRLLEDYGDDVVPYVPLSQELKRRKGKNDQILQFTNTTDSSLTREMTDRVTHYWTPNDSSLCNLFS